MDSEAIVLKHLELQVDAQASELESLSREGITLLNAARQQRVAGDQIMALLGAEPAPMVSGHSMSAGAYTDSEQAAPDWDALREEAILTLQTEGLAPAEVQLPPSEHRLDATDVAAALGFGALGAFIPSLRAQRVGRGFIGDAFHDLQATADKNKLPSVVQLVFGRKPASFMDAGARGIFHRFRDGHDLLVALPQGVRELGWVRGPLEVFQHLLRDSFGGTGIPMPGSELIGRAYESLSGSRFLDDLVSPKDLSRYAAFRMTDAAATGITAMLLSTYAAARGIPKGSMRRPQLGVLAHGLCFVGIAACATIPGVQLLAARRSHLNYISLLALAKHAWAWRGLASHLQSENDEGFALIRDGTAQLEAYRGNSFVDDVDNQLRMAAQLATIEEHGSS